MTKQDNHLATRYDAGLRRSIIQGGGDPVMLEAAGVLPTELTVADHTSPGVGAGLLLISASGVRKLAAIAPDQEAARYVNDFVASKVREGFKVTLGGRHKPQS